MRKLNGTKATRTITRGKRSVVTPLILKRRLVMAKSIQKDAERLVTRISTLTKQWA